jgi:hypothetical protein
MASGRLRSYVGVPALYITKDSGMGVQARVALI